MGLLQRIFFSLTCVDAPSVARGEPFARGFRLIDAGLKENPYLAALLEGELAGCITLQRRADTFRKLLLRSQMPTMLIYAKIAAKYGISEERVRHIIRSP